MSRNDIKNTSNGMELEAFIGSLFFNRIIVNNNSTYVIELSLL